MITAKQLPANCDVLAPDGSEVRILASNGHGSMAHFKLSPGQISKAVAHRTVEELWYIVAGAGRMWIKTSEQDIILDLKPGLSFAIPVGAHFQFRCDGDDPLEAIGNTMPPWPGMDEAFVVEGKW
jgi:mannose-6-phosphate isomerase-like protein (cupin superfamily)